MHAPAATATVVAGGGVLGEGGRASDGPPPGSDGVAVAGHGGPSREATPEVAVAAAGLNTGWVKGDNLKT